MLVSTKKNNPKKSFLNAYGFTMIEMLITITIFVVAITSATAIFIAVVNAQTKSNAQRQTMQDGRYAMETIAREVRMANGSTATPAQPAIKVEHGEATDTYSKLTVTTTDNVGVVTTKVFEYHPNPGPNQWTITMNGTKITSNNIKVTGFSLTNFLPLSLYDPSGVSGPTNPRRQPSVTISITTQQTSGHSQSATTLETTISSRDYIY